MNTQGLMMLTLAALTGCASVEQFTDEHPAASRVIAGSAVLTVYTLTRGHHSSEPDRRISVPGVDCSEGACR